jgi:hypothetical protein
LNAQRAAGVHEQERLFPDDADYGQLASFAIAARNGLDDGRRESSGSPLERSSLSPQRAIGLVDT